MSEDAQSADNGAMAVNMVCPTCRGAGIRRMPRAAVYRGQFGTAIVEETCLACDGSGWLEAVRPPV